MTQAPTPTATVAVVTMEAALAGPCSGERETGHQGPRVLRPVINVSEFGALSVPALLTSVIFSLIHLSCTQDKQFL